MATKETTDQRYARERLAVQNQISRLQRLLATHWDTQNADRENLGFVGDLEEVERRIREVADFIDPAAR